VNSNSENAALGFRVKSGWAASVLLSGPITSPRLCRSFIVDLCDPKIPASRQPYHARMGKLETDSAKINARVRVVHRVTAKSIADLLANCRDKKMRVRTAGIVIGSQIEPELIANLHIRAHALEGQLFRAALDSALRAHRVRTFFLLERAAFGEAAFQLKLSISNVHAVISKLGRSVDGPWRAEQKLAALAAWIALTPIE
jgi:hypothetical protein